MPLDLVLIMPVYNEEGCISDVIRSWDRMLSGLGIRYQMIILNDGSKDGTKEVLASFDNKGRIQIINKDNSGHGPTILIGYRKAVKISTWTFQCDSDDEMKADYFQALWTKRERFDALFGLRKDRTQNAWRKIISLCAKITVRILFGAGVTDVNTPYRLIRSDLLKRIIEQIPDDTFAPNVIISGALSKAGVRIYECDVPYEHRRTGQVSIMKWKLWKAAMKAFRQTLACRPSLKEFI